MSQALFHREKNLLENLQTERIKGRVRRITGLTIEVDSLSAPRGTVCEIHASEYDHSVEAEVIGFRDNTTILLPLGSLEGIKRDDTVEARRSLQTVGVGPEILGRVLDGKGNIIDDGPPVYPSEQYPIFEEAPDPLKRPRISEPLSVGVRAIDGMLTLGRGQRVGLFSGSGVGKSVLLGMISRYTDADVTVIALVGERGREVREFIEDNITDEAREDCVMVVSTSDSSPLMRVKAPFTASAVAEYFRDQGKDVLLLMDSLTRMCHAQREIGLSRDEPPARRGFPPSVFHKLPKLLERAGTNEQGSITGIYTVLVEGDDIDEPISDAARSILDGHIWLDRELAEQGHYPAIDPLESVSRLMRHVTEDEHRKAAERMINLISHYRQSEDLINVGAYVRGSNPQVDAAIEMMDDINDFLRQDIQESASFDDTVERLHELAERANALSNRSHQAGKQQTSQEQKQPEPNSSDRRQREQNQGGSDSYPQMDGVQNVIQQE